MQDFMSFLTDFLGLISSFLLSEPIIYFVAALLLILLIGCLTKIIKFN